MLFEEILLRQIKVCVSLDVNRFLLVFKTNNNIVALNHLIKILKFLNLYIGFQQKLLK